MSGAPHNDSIFTKLANLFGDDDSGASSRSRRSGSIHSLSSGASNTSDDELRNRHLMAQQNAGGHLGLVEPIDFARLDQRGHHRRLPTYEEVTAAARVTQTSRRARKHHMRHSRVISCESGLHGSKIYVFGGEDDPSSPSGSSAAPTAAAP